jgi:hypothetical protein
LIASEILKAKEKSRLHYRIYGTRLLAAGRANLMKIPKKVQIIFIFTDKSFFKSIFVKKTDDKT